MYKYISLSFQTWGHKMSHNITQPRPRWPFFFEAHFGRRVQQNQGETVLAGHGHLSVKRFSKTCLADVCVHFFNPVEPCLFPKLSRCLNLAVFS